MSEQLRTLDRPRVRVERLPTRFVGDDRWVITRPLFVGGELRIRNVIKRVSGLSEAEVERILKRTLTDFQDRHADIESVFDEHYRMACDITEESDGNSTARRQLIGSYFTMEYSIASAALFNPSIVPHPDQTGVPVGAKRFIMSLRATGEGHVSSIIFRTGIILSNGSVQVDPPGRFTHRVRQSPDRQYRKDLFRRKLGEMSVDQPAVDLVMNRLSDFFTFAELEHAINEATRLEPTRLRSEESTQGMRWLAHANYQLRLSEDADISEMVIFPQSDNEQMGIEDLRLVPFVEDDGAVTYFGTYTAFNGYSVLPQLLETREFHTISVHTLNGACAKNKGMALFPRRINGHYCMCSRIDGENLDIMYSDIVQFWETAQMLAGPRYPWEFMQIGNCGSPLETSAGWLLLTHGVGPMRTYCIGAMLLDLDDPTKVIGHLDQPLLMPNEEEREGYVPNVVYSCGALIHNDYLYLPYAMSDTATGFATVKLNALLEKLIG